MCLVPLLTLRCPYCPSMSGPSPWRSALITCTTALQLGRPCIDVACETIDAGVMVIIICDLCLSAARTGSVPGTRTTRTPPRQENSRLSVAGMSPAVSNDSLLPWTPGYMNAIPAATMTIQRQRPVPGGVRREDGLPVPFRHGLGAPSSMPAGSIHSAFRPGWHEEARHADWRRSFVTRANMDERQAPMQAHEVSEEREESMRRQRQREHERERRH